MNYQILLFYKLFVNAAFWFRYKIKTFNKTNKDQIINACNKIISTCNKIKSVFNKIISACEKIISVFNI